MKRSPIAFLGYGALLVGAKLGAKAGEAPFIEGAKDKTAEGMARNLCDRIREWNWQRAGIWAGRSEDSAKINIDKANTAKNIFSK